MTCSWSASRPTRTGASSAPTRRRALLRSGETSSTSFTPSEWEHHRPWSMLSTAHGFPENCSYFELVDLDMYRCVWCVCSLIAPLFPLRYEREGRARKVVRAQQLWFSILEAQIETGNPYMLFKDTANRKSNQQVWTPGCVCCFSPVVPPVTSRLISSAYEALLSITAVAHPRTPPEPRHHQVLQPVH